MGRYASQFPPVLANIVRYEDGATDGDGGANTTPVVVVPNVLVNFSRVKADPTGDTRYTTNRTLTVVRWKMRSEDAAMANLDGSHGVISLDASIGPRNAPARITSPMTWMALLGVWSGIGEEVTNG